MIRVILTAIFIFSPTQLIAQNIDDNFWVSVKPKTLGIDPSKIKSLNRIAFEDSSTQALIVVKDGKLIHEKYADGFDKTSLAPRGLWLKVFMQRLWVFRWRKER